MQNQKSCNKKEAGFIISTFLYGLKDWHKSVYKLRIVFKQDAKSVTVFEKNLNIIVIKGMLNVTHLHKCQFNI